MNKTAMFLKSGKGFIQNRKKKVIGYGLNLFIITTFDNRVTSLIISNTG